MEASRRESGVHAHRIDVSLLPLKKRASNDATGGRGSSPSPDGSYDSPPKKRRVDGGGALDAESNNDAASLEPSAITAALSSTVKWAKKGKWVPPTPNQQQHQPTSSPAAAAAAAAVSPETTTTTTKLMHDAIRSSFTHPINARHAPRVYADGDLGDALRHRLASLGATRPWLVYRKPLRKSDVCPNQNRLLVSCKRETLEGCPITRCFSRAEWERVENKDAGLLVTALDRGGRPHRLTCKFLDSNGGYRFISGWKDFLKDNGVGLDSRGRWTRDVDVEIRAFRSRALPRQPQLDARGRPVKKGDEYVEVPDHFDQEGSLGLILLHYEHRRRRAGEHEDDEDDQDYDMGMAARPPPAAREKGKKQRDKPDAAAPSTPAAGAELGEAVRSESMSKDEMVEKYGDSTSKAIIGLIMLRGAAANSKDDVVEGGDMSKESKG
ncbi:hypothetical protein HU200_036511 [Digitaria exilis]|uniref:TF-B3 domain-containing protein n=1 Tax=Digitaria exilis TaxID=1010633 RepID=A0A835BEV0_9POAL|nr:hypothetical protein HU200_036511 [Digitaria exilis]